MTSTTPQPSVTSEMVEKVAKAMFAKGAVNVTWGGVDDLSRQMFMDFARTAIAALREPTEAMILAGVHHDNMGDMAGRWRAMVDAALANPQTPSVSSEDAA